MLTIDIEKIVNEEIQKFLNKGYKVSGAERNMLAYGVKLGVMKAVLELANVKFENDLFSEVE